MSKKGYGEKKNFLLEEKLRLFKTEKILNQELNKKKRLMVRIKKNFNYSRILKKRNL